MKRAVAKRRGAWLNTFRGIHLFRAPVPHWPSLLLHLISQLLLTIILASLSEASKVGKGGEAADEAASEPVNVIDISSSMDEEAPPESPELKRKARNSKKKGPSSDEDAMEIVLDEDSIDANERPRKVAVKAGTQKRKRLKRKAYQDADPIDGAPKRARRLSHSTAKRKSSARSNVGACRLHLSSPSLLFAESDVSSGEEFNVGGACNWTAVQEIIVCRGRACGRRVGMGASIPRK